MVYILIVTLSYMYAYCMLILKTDKKWYVLNCHVSEKHTADLGFHQTTRGVQKFAFILLYVYYVSYPKHFLFFLNSEAVQ